MSRMYLTMFLMGILYAAFVLILWSSGMAVIFIGIIAGVMLTIQYFMSEKLVLRATGAKEVTREQEPEHYAIGKLLSPHPAVEDRVARLRAMEREMMTGLR